MFHWIMLKSFDYYCDQNSKSQQEDTCVIDNKSLPDEKEEIRSKNLSQEEDLLAHQLAHTLRDGDTDRFIHIYDNCIPAHLSNTQVREYYYTLCIARARASHYPIIKKKCMHLFFYINLLSLHGVHVQLTFTHTYPRAPH